MEPDSGGPAAYNGGGYPGVEGTANSNSIQRMLNDAYQQGANKYGFKVSEVLLPIWTEGC